MAASLVGHDEQSIAPSSLLALRQKSAPSRSLPVEGLDPRPSIELALALPRGMDVYLPIANLAVNGLVIVLLGAATGILSGIFGVGGGFLTTPLLIFYGVPPTVAAASAA